MREENDWRLTNQLDYLRGVALFWKRYHPPREDWDHDHCEFCFAKFMDVDDPEVLREGYADEGEQRWICARCYEDFKDLFDWQVVRAGQ